MDVSQLVDSSCSKFINKPAFTVCTGTSYRLCLLQYEGAHLCAVTCER